MKNVSIGFNSYNNVGIHENLICFNFDANY